MKKYLIIVLLVGVCFGQSDAEPKRSEIITERHENGLKKLVFVYQGEGLDEVLVAKYGFHNNGLKSFIANYKNNLLHGDYSEWHFNGQKAAEAFYKDNLLENAFKTWHENGNLNEELNYQNGKKNGKYIQRGNEGEIISEGNYVNDLKDGEWVSNNGNKIIVNFNKGNKQGKYQEFKNNILIAKGYYANDEKVKKWIYYHDNGNIKEEGSFLKDYADGLWFSFDSLGIKISSQVFEKGKQEYLPYKEFYSDGTIKLNGQFYNWDKIGKWEYFNETGFKTDQKIYKKGKLNGLHERFSKNTREITEYMNGRKTGIWQVWEYGNLSYDGNHKNGDRVGNWNSYEYSKGKNLIVSEANYHNGKKTPDITEFNYNNDGTVLLGTTELFDKYIRSDYADQPGKTIGHKIIRTFFKNGDLKSKKSYEKKIAAWDKEYPEDLYSKYILKGKYLVINKNKEIDTARYFIDNDKYIDLVHAALPELGTYIRATDNFKTPFWRIEYNAYYGYRSYDKQEEIYRPALKNYIQKYYEKLTKELFNSFKSKLVLAEEHGKSDSVWTYMGKRYDFWELTKNEIEEKSSDGRLGYHAPSIGIFNINFNLEAELEKKIEEIADRVAYNLATENKNYVKETLKYQCRINIKSLDFYKNDIEDFEDNYRDKAIDAFLNLRKKEKKYRQTQQIKEEKEQDEAFRICCTYPLLSILILSALSIETSD
jgi:antitoxin component YwqK of YwqJK toxin-antitoxin module